MRILVGSIIAVGFGLGAGWLAWPAGMLVPREEPRARGLAARAEPIPPAPDLLARYREEIQPVLRTYCYDCHAEGAKKGEFALDGFGDFASMTADREAWKRVRDNVHFLLMPPPDEPQPSEQERERLLAWIDDAVFPVDPENPDPGTVAMRRLNRQEYQNTIRDLLGVTVDVNGILPPDDSGYGFDNIGDVLTLSPAHLERYLEAARSALEQAVHLGPMPHPSLVVTGSDLHGLGHKSGEGYWFHGNGTAFYTGELAPGRYRIGITAGGTLGGDTPPTMVLQLNGNEQRRWPVRHAPARPGVYVHELRVEREERARARIEVTFPNDFYDPNHPDPKKRDRNLLVREMKIVGPLDGPRLPAPETHQRIYGVRGSSQSDEAYMTEVLSRFARRAFRRPVKPAEIERYLQFLALAKRNEETVEHAIFLALQAMLVSPSFVFREESLESEITEGKKLLSEHALASRLSYFLWSSMPDERLMELADRGELRAQLDEEIRRMLDSEKAEALVSNFAGQWLQLRDMDTVSPDLKRFQGFDRELAGLLRKETDLLVRHVLQENLPVTTLLDADYTYINERVARHYGISGVTGEDFQRVSLVGTPRRGILGQGAILTLTSLPTRTSPVLRGKYVLENLLDMPPPPPPQNIPALEEQAHNGESLSLRQQMERHREDPSCASCHALMDPIGFGLENYDAVGAWRDQEQGMPIDSAGKLVNGLEFTDADGLRQHLSGHHRKDFHRALATKMLTYALGRGVDWYDRPAIDAIVMKGEAENGRFQSFIRAIVHSVPFQYRR